MSNQASEPLSKITFNAFTRDVDWFRERWPQGHSEKMRKALREFRRKIEKEDDDG